MRKQRRSAGTLTGAVVALVSLFLLLGASAASASTYAVHQCSDANPAVQATQEGGSTGPRLDNACGIEGARYLQAGSQGAMTPGQYRQWAFTAPNGTRMTQVTGTYAIFGSSDANGQQSYFFGRSPGGGDQILDRSSGPAGFISNFDLAGSGHTPLDRVGVGVTCTHSAAQGNCGAVSGVYSRIGGLSFSMEDTVAPDEPTISGPALNGWINGSAVVNYSVRDTGAGVSFGGTTVNFTGVDLDSYCNAAIDGSGAAKQLQPCPTTGSASSTLDVTRAPFIEGSNTLVHCVAEYGSDARQGCNLANVRVDTIAPDAPGGLAVAGGEDWRRDDDFDLSWSNPAQANTAPIVGAEVRISGPGGYVQTTYYSGSERSSIDDVEVPAKGDYTADVYLKDAAGNESAATASSVHLRFDDTIPDPQAPERANGWISSQDLVDGYVQRWNPVAEDRTPPSGIAGYRVAVNTNSDSDPCSGANDPRACGGPITEQGQDNLTRRLRPGDLVEGANYVHVVPISGSGMRATEVKHTPLKADFTDPLTRLEGDGNGEWINHDADLTATATDPLSGMANTGEFPDDEPPIVVIELDGTPHEARNTDSVDYDTAGEGTSQVRYWARDLAGNTSGIATATVRIDKTAPVVAFTNNQDPEDPDRLVAPVGDALSGVVEGEISYRQDGGQQWKGLDTALQGDQLVSRVDSGDMQPGVTYEFRAQATDRAGNMAVSTSKQNGQPMKVTGPFRAITGVVDLMVNGKSRTRITYGRKIRVTGELVTDQGGAPVANASVSLEQSFAEGSKKRVATKTVTTDPNGGFSARLPKGPSRTILARYAGDRRYLGSSSAKAKLRVRGKVSLKAPKAVSSRRGITFKGKIKAKGARIAKRGKRLEVQVRIRNRWKTVGKSIRSNRKGRYRLEYRFTAKYPHAVTYEFRAVVLRERGFPYLRSKSKIRRVTVTP